MQHDDDHGARDDADSDTAADAAAAVVTIAMARKFHCVQCRKFLPETAFYPSNLRRRIHRCREHTRLAAKASHRRQRDAAKVNVKQTASAGRVSWRNVARRVATLMRSISKRSAVPQAPSQRLRIPSWLSDTRVVTSIAARFHGKSVLSGYGRGLVLVPLAHATAQGEQAWEADDSVLVTLGEAAVLACQSEEERANVLGHVAVAVPVVGVDAVSECDDA